MVPAIRERRLLTRAKEPGRPCEDVVLGRPKHGRFALSDGASISFDSRGWARALCWQFMHDTNVGPEWLDRARARFAARSAPPEDDWAAAHAADRGSFATFLGVTVTDARLVVHAIGDTVLFVIGPDAQLAMFPAMAPDDFSGEPLLLCSLAGRGAFQDTDEAFSDAQFTVEAPPGGWGGTRLVAATDALADWIVRAGGPADQLAGLEQLAAQKDRAGFEDWAAQAIADGRLRRDDCAVLVIGL